MIVPINKPNNDMNIIGFDDILTGSGFFSSALSVDDDDIDEDDDDDDMDDDELDDVDEIDIDEPDETAAEPVIEDADLDDDLDLDEDEEDDEDDI